jgi:hypothetical protein
VGPSWVHFPLRSRGEEKAAQARNPLESVALDEKQTEHAGIHGNGHEPTNGTAKTGAGDGGDVGGGDPNLPPVPST